MKKICRKNFKKSELENLLSNFAYWATFSRFISLSITVYEYPFK